MKNIIITGSYGKTAAEELLTEIIKACGLDFNVCKCNLEDLENVRIHPDIILITNVSSYPLKNVNSYREYIEQLSCIFSRQNAGDRVILNSDYKFILAVMDHAVNANIELFNIHSDRCGITFYDKETDTLNFRKEAKSIPVLSIDRLKLPGLRNREVFFSVAAAMLKYVSADVLAGIFENFRGAENHFEYLGKLKGSLVFNNANSYSPSSAVYSLMPFYQKVIFITGGKLMSYPYRGLGLINAAYVKDLIAIGDSADAIEKSTKAANCYDPEKISIYKVHDLQSAAAAAADIVKSDDIIMFAPSTPLEGYETYTQWGREYKKMMNELGVK